MILRYILKIRGQQRNMCGVLSFFSIPFHLLLDNMKMRKDMTAQNLLPLPLVEMFTTNGDLEDQDHLKYVILKIKIRSRS